MASKVDGQQLQDLVCPLCLDVFKNATILSCGHTFCRECLEAYDEQHHRDHIVCPVCMETTNLGQNRIAGLTPNFLARGIQDKLHVAAPSQSFCPLHKSTHNNIFCEECQQFICLKCFLGRHKDHKTKKKEEIQGDFKEKIDFLIRESEMRTAQIEESLRNIEKHRRDICCHFSKIEKEIKDEFAKRVTILQQEEDSLLNELDDIRREKENQLIGHIAFQRQALGEIKQCGSILIRYRGINVDSDAIKTQYLQCCELEKSLKRGINDEPIVRVKQTAESTRFRPSDEKLLALGHIEGGVMEKGNIHQVKTSAGTNKKSEQLPARGTVAVISPPVRSKALTIVRQVEAPDQINGMAALPQDVVEVGYGWGRRGSDRFSVSGEQTQHLKIAVGKVYNIAFLTDGRSVVSHHDKTLRVYSTDGYSTGMQYPCKASLGHIIRLCVDQDDNIYAVNGKAEIYIHGSNPNPQRVISTGDIKPTHICVTKTGALITRSSYNELESVTVFDREGNVGSSITASKYEYLFATVDSQDRVLVARVGLASDVFRLTRYTLQGTTLIQQVTFNELRLSCDTCPPFCMTSLQPKLIAFATREYLYFTELSE